jgi:hypothetical protein
MKALKLLFCLFALTFASRAQAQNWTETGDAGDLVATAQSTAGNGPLVTLDGSLASATDVDVYCVHLTSVPFANFPIVQIQCAQNDGPNVYLFDAAGNGRFVNETCSGGVKNMIAPAASLTVGTYYLAVSYTGYGPQSAGGSIWVPGLPGQRVPDGPGAAGTLTGWAGTPVVAPLNPYHISVKFMGYCEQPTPTLPSTWGALKVHYTR